MNIDNHKSEENYLFVDVSGIPINIFALLFGGAVLGLVLIRGVTNLLLQDCVFIVVVIIVVFKIVVITISILSTIVLLNRKVVP